MRVIIRKHKEDSSKGPDDRFWTCGFVSALITLLDMNPDLDLPRDLGRMFISSQPSTVGQSVKISPATADNAKEVLEKWQAQQNKKIIFFIDEFTADKNALPENSLALFRKHFIDTGGIVVVASTDSGAVTMMTSKASTPASFTRDGPWVFLFTQLPRYVPERDLKEELDSIQGNYAIKKLLCLSLSSRPRLVTNVLDQIRAFLRAPERWSSSEAIEFVEVLRTSVVQLFQLKTGSLHFTGCFGYVLAMLTAGYCFESRDEKERAVFANLSTRNWAFLVNENSLRNQRARTDFDEIQLDGRTDVCIWGTDDAHTAGEFEQFSGTEPLEEKQRNRVYYSLPEVSSALESSLFFRLFKMEKSDKSEEDYLVLTPSPRTLFHCWTFFPDLCDDFLFFLGLAGSRTQQGLRIMTNGQEKRVSTAWLIGRSLETTEPSFSAPQNAISSRWEDEEMIVTAAFVTACNCASFSGSTLEEFLTRFVSELIDARDDHYVDLEVVDKIKWAGTFKAKFVWPYNTEMASEVNKLLGATNSIRPAHSMMFDAGTYFPSETSPGKGILTCLIEVKSTLNPEEIRDKVKEALCRQDSCAKVSFIVVDCTVEHLQDFDLARYEVLNRSVKEGKRYASAGKLENARLFKVCVMNGRVTLAAIDGEKTETADRLIFLISREDIAKQAKMSK
jgi:hypothetical protein